jgi:hypothetical protein
VPAKSDETLAREIRRIDEARLVIRGGNGERGLALLGDYNQEFPRGVLSQEALLLRVEALVRSSKRAQARALAEDLLKRAPDTPHRQRLESLVGRL